MRIKNIPISAYDSPNSPTLTARTGSMKPYRKYPRVADKLANKNLGYYKSSNVDI
jgi:hypothetical protein